MSEQFITELEFLQKLQRLLDEGDFSATYKFALLNALADLSVERQPDMDGSLRLPLDDIAAKFFEYYWPQARPYRPLDGEGFVLRQNAASQALVINVIQSLQERFPTLAAARGTTDYAKALRRVAANIRTMPLWKLQRVGGESDEFLYRESESSNRTIRLLPGVATAFRTLHGFVLHAIRGAWTRQVLQISANRPLLERADLESFLFGTERGTLSSFAETLKAHQRARCLYCGREIRRTGAVDHFIAWSRYPADLGHNLVLTHMKCNGRKRDFLAHPTHVEHWYYSHLDRATELAERFDSAGLPHDLGRTITVAWWAYDQGQRAGAHAWIRKNHLEQLDASWRDAMTGVRLAEVAERESPDYLNDA